MKKLFLLISLTSFLLANDDLAMEEDFLNEFSEELKVEKRFDPLEPYNRVMTSFNDGVYENVVYPVSGYKRVVHKSIRNSIDNFFYNILYPQRLLNNLLQGKFKNCVEETGYFLANTTFGILGLFDVAKEQFNMESHDEDFGQTLGTWGVGSGFHIVLPLLGPSNLRDFAGIFPDGYVDYLNYVEQRDTNLLNSNKESFLVKGYEKINANSLDIEKYHELKKDAIDLYPFLRDSYEQYREKQIKE